MNVLDLLAKEEGYREIPYVDILGYPTVAFGMKLGPKLPGAKKAREAECARLYTFTVPRDVGDVWMLHHVREVWDDMQAEPLIRKALEGCATTESLYSNPRNAVLISMAYQMGVKGLAGFRNTLMLIANQDWFQAETNMLKSRWANQTPNRARRHAWQMRYGKWHPYYSE